jgi:hypothetical protein
MKKIKFSFKFAFSLQKSVYQQQFAKIDCRFYCSNFLQFVLKKFNLILKYSKAIQLVIFVAVIVFDLFYFTKKTKTKDTWRQSYKIHPKKRVN